MPVGKRRISEKPAAVYSRERARAFRQQNLCSCGRLLAEGKKTCEDCIQRNKENHQRIRKIVLEHYGGCCVCCGVSEFEFLAMDHKEGNGNQHRLSVTGHKKAIPYRWYIQNNFPSEFQILCHNCNVAKGNYGVCPHQKGRVE